MKVGSDPTEQLQIAADCPAAKALVPYNQPVVRGYKGSWRLPPATRSQVCCGSFLLQLKVQPARLGWLMLCHPARKHPVLCRAGINIRLNTSETGLSCLANKVQEAG